MCGRYELNETPARLDSRYRIEPGDLDFAQNADVRPTDTNPVILLHEGRRIASMRKWGIVPYWVEDPKAISTPFNARSEEAYAKPMFRGPFKSKRCLVPTTAFFEWQVIEGQKATVLGRPMGNYRADQKATVEQRIRDLRAQDMGKGKIAQTLGVGVSVVQRVLG